MSYEWYEEFIELGLKVLVNFVGNLGDLRIIEFVRS